MKAHDLIQEMQSLENPDRARVSQRYFKTGEGEYGHGDVFLGLSVPQVRLLVKAYKNLPLPELDKLMRSPYHEARLAAALILVSQYKYAKSEEVRKEIFDFYLAHTAFLNNWDLVDSSAEYVVGAWLYTRDRSLLYELVRSESIWERRIAMLASFHFIKKGECADTYRLAEMLLQDKHDLIHKAVGWMLRETGQRCSKEALMEFLDTHTLPRTALRYAIEKFPEEERQYYLKRKPVQATGQAKF